MKKVSQLLHCHPIVEMPKEVSHRKNKILTIEIVSTGILDLLSFSVKGAQYAISAGFNLAAFFFIILYFLRDVLQASVQTITDTMKNRFNEQHDSYIIENVGSISDIVRGKVFSQDKGFSNVMTNSEVILVMKEFISYIWQYMLHIPTTVANILTAFILATGILVTEFIQTQNFQLTLCFCAVLVVCILIFTIIYVFRFKIKNKYREIHRKLRKENEVLFNDVKNIEPLICSEFVYRVNLLVKNIKAKRATEKSEDFRLNVLQVLRSFILAFFMVGIMIIKLYYVGGMENLTLEVITDILAISSVYSAILNKVVNILKGIEEMANIVKDAESVKPDFDNVMNVYKTESSATFTDNQEIDKVSVNPFLFKYSSDTSVYQLRNTTPFTLSKGLSYIVYGHTGCGKSSLMHILTGKIKLDESPISYGEKCKRAYLASIMLEADSKLGSNPILEEIIFNNNYATLDKQKLVIILKGVHIYQEILRNIGLTQDDDDKVIDYLTKTTVNQYSSGQNQRLVIVKVLYNLMPYHQIVVFDEATSALDNTTAKQVLHFISNYCQKDTKRVVFFSTHQVDITSEVTDRNITFKMNQFPIFDIYVS